MGNKDNILTSVKVPEALFEDFKVECIRTKFSIQKLTERAMYLYMVDDSFRKMLHNQLNTFYTGSSK